MGTWTTLRDKATFRVKAYDNTASPKVLTLTKMFDGVEAEPFEWNGSYVWYGDNQRKFGKLFSGLTRDAFQVVRDRGAPIEIAEDSELLTTTGSAIDIEESYILDYILADGIMVPQVPAIWNPYREDTEEDLEDLYMYGTIDLHYRWENDPPKYTLTNTREVISDPYERKQYDGHEYMMPEYDPEEMSDGGQTVYHEAGGHSLDGGNCTYRRAHPGFMGYLQNIPLDLLQQLYYHGGWPYTILDCTVWTLFDGDPSHPNYTSPPGDDPTSCFHGKQSGNAPDYCAVTVEADNSCVNYAARTYNRNYALWKRAFWWNYIINSHNAPMGPVQSGGYIGAGYALLQYSGKSLPGLLPIVYKGKSPTYPSIMTPLCLLLTYPLFCVSPVVTDNQDRRKEKYE